MPPPQRGPPCPVTRSFTVYINCTGSSPCPTPGLWKPNTAVPCRMALATIHYSYSSSKALTITTNVAFIGQQALQTVPTNKENPPHPPSSYSRHRVWLCQRLPGQLTELAETGDGKGATDQLSAFIPPPFYMLLWKVGTSCSLFGNTLQDKHLTVANLC